MVWNRIFFSSFPPQLIFCRIILVRNSSIFFAVLKKNILLLLYSPAFRPLCSFQLNLGPILERVIHFWDNSRSSDLSLSVMRSRREGRSNNLRLPAIADLRRRKTSWLLTPKSENILAIPRWGWRSWSSSCPFCTVDYRQAQARSCCTSKFNIFQDFHIPSFESLFGHILSLLLSLALPLILDGKTEENVDVWAQHQHHQWHQEQGH